MHYYASKNIDVCHLIDKIPSNISETARNKNTEMTKELLDELQTNWPRILRNHARSLSDVINQISFLRRRRTISTTSTLSSVLNEMDSTIQHRWSACSPDICTAKSMPKKTFTLCDRCFQPSDSVRVTNLPNFTRERQCSEPVRVPDSLATAFVDHQPQSQRLESLGYGSTSGNELSPSTTSWTLGMNDTSSRLSITSDELSTDQEQSIFDDDDSLTASPLEESFVNPSDDECDDDDDDEDSFEVLSFEAAPESSLYIKEFPFTTVSSQENRCYCCSTLFTSTNRPRRCHYYGKLYCSRCHLQEKAHIPAKIIQTLDMRLYPVCRRAKLILQLNSHQPHIDIPNDNDHLYVLSPILNEIKTLRVQFRHFYAYLSTCTRLGSHFYETYFKQFYARDYLYQSVHLYSINDFLSLKKILQILQQTSQRAKEHISQCPICREKGFTCEICKKRRDILYPFDDIKTIGQCSTCSNIYHKKCWLSIEGDCPKCYRLIQRRHEQFK